jgi:hypothetical protein
MLSARTLAPLRALSGTFTAQPALAHRQRDSGVSYDVFHFPITPLYICLIYNPTLLNIYTVVIVD